MSEAFSQARRSLPKFGQVLGGGGGGYLIQIAGIKKNLFRAVGINKKSDFSSEQPNSDWSCGNDNVQRHFNRVNCGWQRRQHW